MDIEIRRAELRELRCVERPSRPLAEGEVRLGVEAFGITANNVTYAVIGDMLRYWEFFPAAEDPATWGRVPVWGYASAVESRHEGVPEGTRVFGYLPMASELVVEPGRLDADGSFTDLAAHRQPLPSVYNRYVTVAGDRMYAADREDQDILLRPLFVTSFTIDDFLADRGDLGAEVVAISSASAKTAIGAAYLLHARGGLEVVGLTSPANRAFVESLGCYHRVLSYDEVGALEPRRSVYVDVAGRRDVTAAVHAHLGEQLAYSMVVGDTHWEAEEADVELVGPRPELLFAPAQIAKRREEWGREGFEERVARSWHAFTAWSDGWLRVEHRGGAQAIVATFLEVLEGEVPPSVAHVCRF